MEFSRTAALILCSAFVAPLAADPLKPNDSLPTVNADASVEDVKGVVVEEVDGTSTLARAGLEPGDLLLHWRRLPAPPANPEEASGVFESPFDWMWLVVEQAPRGTVELYGQRGDEKKVWVVERGFWEAEVRPWMEDEVLMNYQNGLKYLDYSNTDQGVRSWKNLTKAEERPLRCWINLRLTEVWIGLGKWNEASVAYSIAAKEADSPRIEKLISQEIGELSLERLALDIGEESLLDALRTHKESVGESENLLFAEILDLLGLVYWHRRDIAMARDYFQRSLSIRQRMAPLSLEEAESLNNIVWTHSEALDLFESYLIKALKIRQELAPNSIFATESINNLGVAAWYRQDFPAARNYFNKAYNTIKEKN